MSDFLKKLGIQIKGYRELQKYSQETLAEKVNVAANTVSAWENGKSFLEYPTIIKLCNALCIDEEDLFSFCTLKSISKDSNLNKILNLSQQISPAKQKQVIQILETFVD